MAADTQILSINDLAKAIGISSRAMRRHLGRREWTFGRTPPWNKSDCEKILKWLLKFHNDRESGGTDDAGSSEYHEEKVRKLKAQRLTLEFKLRTLAGKFHDVEHCKKRRIAQLAELRTRLRAVGNETSAAARIATTDAEAAKIIQARIDQILGELAEKVERWK